MSKKTSLIMCSVSMLMICAFFAYFSKQMNETLEEYMNGYLNDPQKYLYLITIFIVAALFVFKIPVYDPFIRIRLRDNLFNYIINRGIRISLYFSLFLFLLFFVMGIIFNLAFSFSFKWIYMLLNIFVFSFCCYILSVTVYYISNKLLLGILSVIFANYFLLVFVYAVDFYILNNTLSEKAFMIIFRIYMTFITTFGLIYLYIKSEKKECI